MIAATVDSDVVLDQLGPAKQIHILSITFMCCHISQDYYTCAALLDRPLSENFAGNIPGSYIGFQCNRKANIIGNPRVRVR